ncbi:MAG: hypothetical protein V4579_07570 [Pseudomonadota bacterium]
MHGQAGQVVLGTRWAFTAAVSNWFGQWPNLLLFFVALSIVLRMASFGHPNIDGDETFYFLVGQAMHDGAVPYVDVWDRKPIGLFVLFWLIAGVSRSVIAYQVTAALFAGMTALVVARIARRWAGGQGAILAGTVYLLLLPLFWGYGGQAPVFYNLFVSLCALLVLQALPTLREGGGLSWRICLAMLVGGIAITIKQTALFEAAYFGLFVAAVLYRSSMPRARLAGTVLILAAIGAGPTLAAAAWYGLAGHWGEYWHAMVTSNIAKQKPDTITVLARSLGLYFRIAPLVCVTLLGLVLGSNGGAAHGDRKFLIGWLAAATLGFLSVPNFYMHYALPLLVPLCVAAAIFFSRRDLGIVAFAVIAGLSYHWYYPFARRYTEIAQISVGSLARSIRQHDGGGGLLVFDGPPLLYALAEKRFLSPLVLPSHFNYAVERNVSHLDTSAEMARVLAAGPGVVVMPVWNRNPRNEETWQQVLSYVSRNCRLVDAQLSYEYIASGLMAVYGDCRPHRGTQR